MKSWLLGLVWATASFLMYWTMSHGPGITPDSIVYLKTARSILAGHGFVVAGVPMTHFPPLYPLLIAMVGLLDHDLLHAARLLAAVLFGANVVLVGSAVYLATGRRVRAAACAVLLFAISAPVLDLHAMAWSEAPFLAFALSGLLVLSATISFPSRRMLVLASLCLGLAAATRYVGITLFPVLCLALWFLGHRTIRQRIIDTLIALPVAVAPLALWMLRNASVAHGVTDRKVVWHPVTTAALSQLIETLNDLLFPMSGPVIAKLGMLQALVALLAVMWLRRTREPTESWYAALGNNLPVLAVLFSVTYVAFLLLSISIADAGTPLDERLLYPVFGCMVVAAAIIGDGFVRPRPERWLRWAALGAVLLSLGLRIQGAEETVLRVHRDGSGYNSDAWRSSPAIAQLKPLPRGILVYSNASEAVGYLTNRAVLAIPDSLVSETLLPNPHYRAQLRALCSRVLGARAVVVYLTTEGIGDADEKVHLEGVCPFPVAAVWPDGTIYGADSVVEKPPYGGLERQAPHPGVVAMLAGRVGRRGEGSYIPPPKAR